MDSGRVDLLMQLDPLEAIFAKNSKDSLVCTVQFQPSSQTCLKSKGKLLNIPSKSSGSSHSKRVLEEFEKKLLTEKQMQMNLYPMGNDEISSSFIRLEKRPKGEFSMEIEQMTNDERAKEENGYLGKRNSSENGETKGNQSQKESRKSSSPSNAVHQTQFQKNQSKEELSIEELVYGVDCEMVTTNAGFELARATVVNYYGDTVYDAFVKPKNPIQNYNTKYSGITEEILRDVTLTLKDVQRDLQKFLFSDSILVGHSLENDLRALKIVHHKIIDTSVLFMGASGTKTSLKQLSAQFLKLRIQEETHDSGEDAAVAMALAKLKVTILDSFSLVKGTNFKEDLPQMNALLEQGLSFHVFGKMKKMARFKKNPSIQTYEADFKEKKSIKETLKCMENVVKSSTKSITIGELNFKECGQEEFEEVDKMLQKMFYSNPSSTPSYFAVSSS